MAIAQHALEFEVLLHRSLRQGRLDPYELLDSYAGLNPSLHPHLGNSRKVDLHALSDALLHLPRSFFQAPRVYVVPHLEGFEDATLINDENGRPAAHLNDGSLLLAVDGFNSLLTLATKLCVLAHELDKIHALVALDEDGGEDVEPTLAHTALLLGCDESALRSANSISHGALLEILQDDWSIPPLAVHADLDSLSLSKSYEQKGRKFLTWLAESGFYGRPLHLWIGSRSLTDCVSPYVRDLRPVLLAWAQKKPQLLGNDLQGALDQPSEDVLYAVARDFLHSDARLISERNENERAVGIFNGSVDDFVFEAVDLRRFDRRFGDARLGKCESSEGVLLRFRPPAGDHEALLLRTILATLASVIESITVVSEMHSAKPGVILHPQALVRWAGEQKIVIPELSHFAPEELPGADFFEQGGLLYAVPHETLLANDYVEDLRKALNVRGICLGGENSAVVHTLAEARWMNILRPQTEIVWAAVAGQNTQMRPQLGTLSAYSALAIARLRRVLKPRENRSERVERVKKARVPGRSIHIKA